MPVIIGKIVFFSFSERFTLTALRFGMFRLILGILMVFYEFEVLPLLRISIHIFESDLISQVHFLIPYVQDRDSLRREGQTYIADDPK